MATYPEKPKRGHPHSNDLERALALGHPDAQAQLDRLT